MGNPVSKSENKENVLAQAQVNLSGIQNMQNQMNYFTIAIAILLCIVALLIIYCLVRRCNEVADKWILKKFKRMVTKEKMQDGTPHIVIS